VPEDVRAPRAGAWSTDRGVIVRSPLGVRAWLVVVVLRPVTLSDSVERRRTSFVDSGSRAGVTVRRPLVAAPAVRLGVLGAVALDAGRRPEIGGSTADPSDAVP